MRLCVAVALLALAACTDPAKANGTALFIVAQYDGGLGLTQLFLSGRLMGGSDVFTPSYRPEQGAGVLMPPQSVRVLLADGFGGSPVTVEAVGYSADGTPVGYGSEARVVEAMLPYFTEKFGNAASRNHSFGWESEEAVDIAREQVAGLIGAGPKEIVFTSGATEGVNLAIKGVFEAYASKGNHIITAVTEHRAVLDTCLHLERAGAEVTWLPVTAEGLIRPGDLIAAIRPDTILISIMYANNETGVLQPIKEISRIAREHQIPFFTDATQAVGKMPVDVERDGIDLMAFSAHKIYGPKGVGALYVRRRDPRIRLKAQMDGGGHERGMRSGTLNTPGIVGFGRACDLCRLEMGSEMNGDNLRIQALRDRLETALLGLEGVHVNGSRTHRLPQMTNLSFDHVNGDVLLSALNKDIALSSGSACTSASPEPSYVLKAMGVEDGLAHSSLRFGLGRYTTEEEIDHAIGQVSRVIRAMRILQ